MKLNKLLAELRNELRRAEDIDAESRRILQDLHSEIEDLVEPEPADVKSLIGRLKAMESRLAAEHPVLEQAMRELADTLAKMGV